jgi:hypothetical protein
MTVSEQNGNGVTRVGCAKTEALLAVTVTSKPSVTVRNTVGGTELVYVIEPSQVGPGVTVLRLIEVESFVKGPLPGDKGGGVRMLVVVAMGLSNGDKAGGESVLVVVVTEPLGGGKYGSVRMLEVERVSTDVVLR